MAVEKLTELSEREKAITLLVYDFETTNFCRVNVLEYMLIPQLEEAENRSS